MVNLLSPASILNVLNYTRLKFSLFNISHNPISSSVFLFLIQFCITNQSVQIDIAILEAKEYKKFEDIKYVREDESEYWSARELAAVLDYPNGETFKRSLIER